MNKLQFKISAALKNIIGRDLITDDFIAVFELVKNSYDAYASEVKILFEDDRVIISDNGKGMSFEDLQDKWLFLAYSAKKEETEDNNIKDDADYRDKIQAKRYFAGAKGIGRFSCDRLGNELILTTRKDKTNKVERLYVKWDDFNNSEDEFINISVLHETLPTNDFPDLKKGTILEISHLNSSWQRKKLQELKHSLEKLINPFENNEQFDIQIICNKELSEDENGVYTTGSKEKKGKKYSERDKVNGSVNNFIFEKLEVKTTQIKTNINKNEIVTELIDRGELIYKIKEPNTKYNYLDNVNFNIFFLNKAAKNNFNRLMGIDNVKFGSIFLFKNGFRVQPYGNHADDSYRLDRRRAQGYARFFGTRELLGRIELTTNLNDQFKEVSSRDGGLVETDGLKQLIESFYDYGIKRLEKYVVGIQWAYKLDARLEGDKDRDDLLLLDTVKHKARIIELITKLTDNKNVELLNYNKNFLDIIDDKIQDITPDAFKNLQKIAKKIHDNEYVKDIQNAEKRYLKLLKQKEEAEIKAEQERLKREEEVKKRIEAELKAKRKEDERKKEEERANKAELEVLRKENERLKAEQKAQEAERKAQEEEKKRIIEEEARKKAESEALRRKEQLIHHKSAETIEYKDLRDSNHIIGVYSDDISKKILLLKRNLDKGKIIDQKQLFSFIQGISLANEKIATLTRFTTKANFLKASLETKQDIVSYIVNYIRKTYQALYTIDIEIINEDISYIKKFQPIELSLIIDNILSNSRKKSATKVIFEFNIVNKKLQIKIKDIGKILSNKIQNWKLIFEEGITTTKGSGLGLSHVKRIVEEDLKGIIKYNPNYTKGFELIITI